MSDQHDKLWAGLQELTEVHKKTAWLVREALDAERQAYKELARYKVKIAKMLRRYRESYGMSVTDLAARTKWSKSYIHYMETGQRWSPEVVAAVLRVYSDIDKEGGQQ